MFMGSWLILASVAASSTQNECVHSVADRICSKLRQSMLPDTIERLTLGYYFIIDLVKRKAGEFAARMKVADSEVIDLSVIDAMLAEDEVKAVADTGASDEDA